MDSSGRLIISDQRDRITEPYTSSFISSSGLCCTRLAKFKRPGARTALGFGLKVSDLADSLYSFSGNAQLNLNRRNTLLSVRIKVRAPTGAFSVRNSMVEKNIHRNMDSTFAAQNKL